MAEDVAATLARIERSQQNFAEVLAIVVQRLTRVGERLEAIEALLTPEPEDPARPKLRDLIEQGFAAEEQALRIISTRLLDIHKGVRNLPLDTVRALDDNQGKPARSRSCGTG